MNDRMVFPAVVPPKKYCMRITKISERSPLKNLELEPNDLLVKVKHLVPETSPIPDNIDVDEIARGEAWLDSDKSAESQLDLKLFESEHFDYYDEKYGQWAYELPNRFWENHSYSHDTEQLQYLYVFYRFSKAQTNVGDVILIKWTSMHPGFEFEPCLEAVIELLSDSDIDEDKPNCLKLLQIVWDAGHWMELNSLCKKLLYNLEISLYCANTSQLIGSKIQSNHNRGDTEYGKEGVLVSVWRSLIWGSTGSGSGGTFGFLNDEAVLLYHCSVLELASHSNPLVSDAPHNPPVHHASHNRDPTTIDNPDPASTLTPSNPPAIDKPDSSSTGTLRFSDKELATSLNRIITFLEQKSKNYSTDWTSIALYHLAKYKYYRKNDLKFNYESTQKQNITTEMPQTSVDECLRILEQAYLLGNFERIGILLDSLGGKRKSCIPDRRNFPLVDYALTLLYENQSEINRKVTKTPTLTLSSSLSVMNPQQILIIILIGKMKVESIQMYLSLISNFVHYYPEYVFDVHVITMHHENYENFGHQHKNVPLKVLLDSGDNQIANLTVVVDSKQHDGEENTGDDSGSHHRNKKWHGSKNSIASLLNIDGYPWIMLLDANGHILHEGDIDGIDLYKFLPL